MFKLLSIVSFIIQVDYDLYCTNIQFFSIIVDEQNLCSEQAGVLLSLQIKIHIQFGSK